MFITRFNWVDDGTCEILVEGNTVFTFGYDDSATPDDLVQIVGDAVTAVTKAAGGTVITTES